MFSYEIIPEKLKRGTYLKVNMGILHITPKVVYTFFEEIP